MFSSWCNCTGSYGVSDFEQIHSSTANGIIPVTKYISKSTGLTVVHADIEGPIVSGYVCVATRASDDDGLPHTLEHLVFLGSEGYPYSGILDRAANKCLASGTNAWTDVDHTSYTLSTAGNEGFYQLLPIFMDHILFPLLTDSAFKTEVYHVGGLGNDAGVIYSEIMALENTSYSRATEVLFKELYPQDSGYRWNVGGALCNLRDTCCNEKVKEFHTKFYHPENICVIICGKVDLKRVFRSLYPVIRKTLDYEDANVRVTNPWLSEEAEVIPDVSSPVEKTVQFPSFDEEGGCLATVGFLGPSVISEDLKDTYALLLLFKYLTKSACAPLQQDFVEKDTDFLANSLDFNAVEYSRTAFIFELDGVAVEDKSKIVGQLRKSLEIALKSFDMSRMEDVIKTTIQAELSLIENAPHGTVAEAVIRDFLYGGNDFSRFEKRLNRIAAFENLLQEPVSFWTEIIKNQILSSNWVAIFAEPSKSLMKELAAREDARISQRKLLLGESGLANYMHQLDNAILQNARPIPKKVLRKVKVPSMKCIQYHHIDRIKNPVWVPTGDFPATLCLDDISTSFIYVGLLMDTSKLESELREFLPLFKEMLLNSPILGNANATKSHHDLIPFEEVCASRDRALQVCELDFGLELDFKGEGTSRFSCGSYSHILALGLQMETNKVEEGMLWIKKILWTTRWTTDRIKVAVNKMMGDVYNLKRDGSRMCQTILKHLIYKESSNVVTCSLITQSKFLQDLGADDDDTLARHEREIRKAFDAILRVITNPNNVSLHIAANVQKLRSDLEKLPCGNLGNLLKTCLPFQEAGPRQREFANFPDMDWMIPTTQIIDELRTTKGNPKKNQIIFGLGSEDSSYLAMIAPGPRTFLDSDLPALLTTLQYFTQMEGPLFQKIRGEGLAYSYNVVTKVNEGLIYFHLYRCADLVGAYSACLGIISDHLKRKNSKIWCADLLVSARNSLIFECLETEKTPLSRAANSCLDYYRNVPGTYIRDLVVKIAKVKMKHVKKMTKKYLDVLFHSPKSNYATVVVCPEERAEGIQKGLENLGKQMRIVKSFRDL